MGLGGLALGLCYSWRKLRRNVIPEAACAKAESSGVRAGEVKNGLPDYSLDEVSRHRSQADGGIWVTYREGVYDITEFVDLHPGGQEKVMLAAGGAIDPYWEVFAQHNTEEVYEMLEELRIGNISPEDRKKLAKQGGAKEGPYANDPHRSPILKVNTQEPFNAETPTVLLTQTFLTPNDLFFVRNHLPVPVVNPETFVLEVRREGVEPPVRLTLQDLKEKFRQYSVTATIQCAGNRRIEMSAVKEVKGIKWTGGAIGNATWTGVRLRDVLLYAGVSEEDQKVEHVHLEGLDKNPLTGEKYGASIPVEKAMDPRGDCILAFEMNGEEIPRDHGYPLRAVIPGVVGARNVKWLSQILASSEEYPGQWQQRDYKGFSPSVDWSNVDFTASPAIQELPVQSLISSPPDGSTLTSHEDVSLRGIAWSGGGRPVVRVDVSADGGKTWHVADITDSGEQRRGQAWAWTFWSATVPVPTEVTEGTGGKNEVEVCCKAVDMSYNVQPDTVGPIWNLRGCLSNAWHRIHLRVPPAK